MMNGLDKVHPTSISWNQNISQLTLTPSPLGKPRCAHAIGQARRSGNLEFFIADCNGNDQSTTPQKTNMSPKNLKKDCFNRKYI